MLLKKFTHINCTLIGLLLPFISTVCLGSSGGKNFKNINYFDISESSISVNNGQDFVSKNGGVKDIDFIKRGGNFRILDGKGHYVLKLIIQPRIHSDLRITSAFLVPKPAYYNFLFMFKPFE